MRNLNEVLSEIARSKFPNYVYILYKPDGTPFYVGKGGWNRVSDHEKEAKSNGVWLGMNTHKLNTIRKIWREGGEVKYGIDSWHETGESANNREIDLIAAIGRRCKNEGTLTNVAAGGKGVTDLPEEIRERISQKLQQYCADHPEVVDKLQSKKDEWIENNPEEYAEVERRRLEVCNSEEVRRAVSETLKEYHLEHPELSDVFSERASRWFEEHPEAVENARQNSTNNRTCDYIINWLATADEDVLQEKWRKHGEWLKEWHATEEGKATTKIAAQKRNEKVRTKEHREYMAEATAKYIRENPEADKARRAKVKEKVAIRMAERQKRLQVIQERLFGEGKVRKKAENVSSFDVSRWKKRGLLSPEEIECAKY